MVQFTKPIRVNHLNIKWPLTRVLQILVSLCVAHYFNSQINFYQGVKVKNKIKINK